MLKMVIIYKCQKNSGSAKPLSYAGNTVGNPGSHISPFNYLPLLRFCQEH